MVKRYAGYKADDIDGLTPDDNGIVTLQDEHYKVYEGYLVPYYPVADGSVEVDREKLALDLARRFFRNAEIGINATFRYFDIKDLQSKYEMMEPGNEKRATGALIVGAMVNRMERLAHCIIQERVFEEGQDLRFGLAAVIADMDSVSVEENGMNEIAKNIESFNHKRLSENMYTRDLYREQAEEGEEFPSVKDQFAEYFSALILNKDLIANVRRRNRSVDIDGMLDEMLSEMGKSTQTPLDMIYDGRALKIGQAMAAMDQVRDQLLELADHTETRVKTKLVENINTFTDAARQRVGMKTDDAEAYAPAEIRFKQAESQLFIQTREEIDKLRTKSTSSANPKLDALQLIHRGAGIIDDMAEIRQAREIYDGDKTRNNSSLIRFAEDTRAVLVNISETTVNR